MKKVKRYGAEVLEFKNQWANEALTKTGKRIREGEGGSLQIRAAGEKSARAFGIPDIPGEPGQMRLTSQGRAVTKEKMVREELGPLASKVGYTAEDFVKVLMSTSAKGDINWGRLNARGKEKIKEYIRSKRNAVFTKNGQTMFTRGFQQLHRPLLDGSRNRFLDRRQKNILKQFDNMASSKGRYQTNERLMFSLLDMMPDDMVDRLAISIQNDIVDEAAHYSNHPAAGIMTLTLSNSDAHTFFHEFMHHIQTFIAPEDLEGLALQFKRALMAEDTQGLISTLYFSSRTRIKNEVHLRELIEADSVLHKKWVDMRGGEWKARGDQGYGIGAKAPTEADWNAIIQIMQDTGKLPPSFNQASNPSFDIEKYGPWKTDDIVTSTLHGGVPL